MREVNHARGSRCNFCDPRRVDFLVKRDALEQTRIAEAATPALDSGQALLEIDAFALTSNNITYAVFGEAMSYWSFFPAEEGWGRVPVWGFADVASSAHEGLAVGARVFGFLPMSTGLVVTPEPADGRGFADATPHRAALPATYNRYLLVDSDPAYDSGRESEQMLLKPLFTTSFLIDDFLDDEGLLEGASVVLSSASSKTALSAAFLLAERDGVEVFGLTSAGNVGFVEGLGPYDRVVPYGEIGSLPQGDAVYVDMAGDASTRAAVHRHYGDSLRHSAVVGATHWDSAARGEGQLAGPEPQFFFAPDRVAKRAHDWGVGGLESRTTEAWHRYVDWTGGWLRVVRGDGPEAVERAYRELLGGGVDPAVGHVLSMRA
jgi:hypothetical protein